MVMIVLHCVISTIKSLLELICIIVFVFQVLKLRSIIIIISVGGQNQNPTGFSRRSLNIIDCKRRSKSIRSSGKIDDAGVFLLSTEFTVFPLHFSSAHICLFGSWTQENEAKRQDFTVFENHTKVSTKAERGRPKADRAKRL